MDAQFDVEIEVGHTFCDLVISLKDTRDEKQEIFIRSTMASLVEESQYLREVLLRNPQPLLSLASREQRSYFLVRFSEEEIRKLEVLAVVGGVK